MNKQKKTRAIVACSVAGTVMLGALVYYNFIDKPINELTKGATGAGVRTLLNYILS